MKHEPKKHFDISRPSRHGPDPTSKPIIVGHHPMMPDPMIREEKVSKPISVTSDGDESEILSVSNAGHKVIEPTKADNVPELSDISAPHETSPALTPSAEPAPQPESPTHATDTHESVPGALFSPTGATPESAATPLEPKMPDLQTPPASIQPLPTIAKPPEPLTSPEPPAGQELHIPAGHGHSAVHHKPRIWVWALVGLIILVWIYAAIDALTDTKLPIEFFKKDATTVQQPVISPPTSQTTQNEATFVLPEGWTYYENEELGFKFAHPKTWSEVKLDISEGYVDPTNLSSQKGTSTYTGAFIKNDKISFRIYSNKYFTGGRGGFSPITFANYCVSNQKLYGQYADGSCKVEEGFIKNPEVVTINGKEALIFESISSDGGPDPAQKAFGAIIRLNISSEFPTIVFEDLQQDTIETIKKVASSTSKL